MNAAPDCNETGFHGRTDRRSKCQHADDAAEKAVKKTFAILGVDIDRPEQVRDFQESLRFGDKLRKASDKGFYVFVALFVSAIFGVMWLGVKERLRGGL